MTLQEQFRAARRVSTPLVAISTPDQAATSSSLSETCAAYLDAPAPILQWDIVRGITNAADHLPASAAAASLYPEGATVNPVDALLAAQGMPAGSVLFLHNAHRILEDPGACQALANLRDQFKRDRRTVVLLAPAITLPAQLQYDVLQLDEAFPDRAALGAIVQTMMEAAGLAALEEGALARATDALAGLPACKAEESTALSIRREGLDIAGLWEHKRRQVEKAPGSAISIWRGADTFATLAGCSNIKQFLLALLNGRNAPKAIFFLDEVEKMSAGGADDGKPKIFRDTLITNIEEFLSTFQARNLTDDNALQACVEQARSLLHGVDAQKLRDNGVARQTVARGMQEIKATLDGMMRDAPSRAIALDD